jgi:hypothetical protein
VAWSWRSENGRREGKKKIGPISHPTLTPMILVPSSAPRSTAPSLAPRSTAPSLVPRQFHGANVTGAEKCDLGANNNNAELRVYFLKSNCQERIVNIFRKRAKKQKIQWIQYPPIPYAYYCWWRTRGLSYVRKRRGSPSSDVITRHEQGGLRNTLRMNMCHPGRGSMHIECHWWVAARQRLVCIVGYVHPGCTGFFSYPGA